MKEDKQDVWYSIEITTKPEAVEAIEFALNELDSLGTEIDNLRKNKGEDIKIVGYFNEKPDEEILQNYLNEALRIYGFSKDVKKATEWKEIENQDWLAEWKKHWRPTETEKFIIAPPWEEIETSEKIIIKIEPNMAFGTGTHETTRLCLKAIEENYSPEMGFFDVGTGTGILSIAVAKIQRKNQKERGKILACDTDEDSVKIAKENAELNDAKEIEFYVGSISEKTAMFDFVCANVTADVIIPILPLLLEKAEKVLVLSGILVEQEDLIANKLSKLGITKYKVETDGEWISILIEKD